MDKATFLAKIIGNIDGSKIPRPTLHEEFLWYTYGGVVWLWGKKSWNFAVGIVFGGKYFGCDNPANPPVSSKCIIFYDSNDEWIEAQDDTMCNDALASLPYCPDITNLKINSHEVAYGETIGLVAGSYDMKPQIKNISTKESNIEVEVTDETTGELFMPKKSFTVPADGLSHECNMGNFIVSGDKNLVMLAKMQ